MLRRIKVDQLAFKIEIVWSARLTSLVKIYRLPIMHKIIGGISLIGREKGNSVHNLALLVAVWVVDR